jgi:hypothetical protein
MAVPLMLYSFADSLRVPTFRRSWYFLRTDSLWYCRTVLASVLLSNITAQPMGIRRYNPVAKSSLVASPPSDV